MKCVSCGAKDKELYEIESETASYHACLFCLSNALKNLKKMTHRTPDENELMRQLKVLIGRKVIKG